MHTYVIQYKYYEFYSIIIRVSVRSKRIKTLYILSDPVYAPVMKIIVYKQ